VKGLVVDIETIDREELKAKLDRGEDFKLVMTLHDWAFRALHIPGSIHFHSVEDALEGLAIDDEIVVYCSNVDCVASQFAYRGLVDGGYTNVRRYSGGLADWDAAGLPLEGESAR
jgi:rhodanese-related sulfurtransferase